MPYLAPAHTKSVTIRAAGALATVCALALLGLNAHPAAADTLSRSAEVKGTPAEVWATIGSFCSIKDWHPAIATCTEDGQTPPVRTLVTKDGKATFVEMQTARSDTKFIYAYNFVSSPFPVTHYAAQIEVAPKSAGVSTVTWTGAYVPNPGKEKEALEALRGVYESGLAAIKATRAK
jgi:hypothetical protein